MHKDQLTLHRNGRKLEALYVSRSPDLTEFPRELTVSRCRLTVVKPPDPEDLAALEKVLRLKKVEIVERRAGEIGERLDGL